MSYSILFVDDEEKSRKYFYKMFSNDFDILLASNVSEAKTVVDEKYESIGVVITDQKMFGGIGNELLEYLKQKYPKIVRLLTTAFSDFGDTVDAINKGGVYRYIQKPWNKDQLNNELLHALELFEIRSQGSKLLEEKLSVQRKLMNLGRLREIILSLKLLKHLTIRSFSLRNYVENIIKQNSDHSIEGLLEVGFEIIFQSIVSCLSSRIEDYSLDSKISEFADQKIKINYSEDVAVNSYTLNIAIKTLARFEIDKTLFSNVFTSKDICKDDIELLLAYIFVGYNGGIISINEEKVVISFDEKSQINESIFSEQFMEDLFILLFPSNF